jgi:hypothetical protein
MIPMRRQALGGLRERMLEDMVKPLPYSWLQQNDLLHA